MGGKVSCGNFSFKSEFQERFISYFGVFFCLAAYYLGKATPQIACEKWRGTPAYPRPVKQQAYLDSDWVVCQLSQQFKKKKISDWKK